MRSALVSPQRRSSGCCRGPYDCGSGTRRGCGHRRCDVTGGTASANCLLNDSPNWVATTATGTYTASRPHRRAILDRDGAGRGGGHAAQLSNGGTAAVNYCILNDSPNWVATTATGTYTASLWVRTDTPGSVKLKLQEFRKDSGVFVGAASTTIATTTAWQQVSVRYTPVLPGISTLDYNVYTGAAPGTCFYADDAAIAYQT